jgi:S-formylglutathione hydrolase FrmB
VVLPPEYNEEKYAHTRFPVVIVMPGYPGTPKIYLTRVPLPATMRTEVAAGRATPFIAVIIKESVATPRDTECADVMGGPKVETFLSREVPNDLMRLLRVRRDRSGWALLGNSTGGFCAIKLAMRHPDRFASAVSMSGYFTAILDSTTGDLYGHSRRVRDLNNPLWRLGHLPAPPIAALVSVSRNEPLWPGTRRFLAAVKLPMQVDSIIAPTGGHNTRQWAAVLPKAVDWLGLRFGPLTGPATPRAKNLVKAR